MSADFWAGYISGAVGILIGNPLDLIKVRLQARDASLATQTPASYARQFQRGGISSVVAGTAAPVLGYGALNALLFVSYNRTEAALLGSGSGLFRAPDSNGGGTSAWNPWTTWVAGAVGGLATWVVSAPTELIKCRAQLAAPSSSPASSPPSSWAVARDVFRREGVRGFYLGGAVTAARDAVGYGFYFWTYELCSRWMESRLESGSAGGSDPGSSFLVRHQDAAKVLLCGGLSGIATWASIFPLDVIKTRVQTQQAVAASPAIGAAAPLLPASSNNNQRQQRRLGAVEIARNAYREEGVRVFFRGLTVCSVRAFFVNAVQWAVYEWIMLELGQGRHQKGGEQAVNEWSG